MNYLNSLELNMLVFRYLNESGFTHSAFPFAYEAGINKSPIDWNLVPPGSLIKLVQKGLQYLEMEVNSGDIDADVDQDFSFLQPLDLITKEIPELQQIIKEKKAKIQKERERDTVPVMGFDHEQEKQREQERIRERKEKNQEQEQEKRKEKQRDYFEGDSVGVREDKRKRENRAKSGGSELKDISTCLPCLPLDIPTSDVTILEGHTSEVYACAWSPVDSLLASMSGDSTTRIWTIADGPCSPSMQNRSRNELVLKHIGGVNEKPTGVTSLNWNGEGTLLSTGSSDGRVRIWSKEGKLRGILNKHIGPIFSLKWNKAGDYLLSGSVDTTAIVWDMKAGKLIQQFQFHSGPTLDVDWRNTDSFATCSSDTTINVFQLGERRPLKTFSGHRGEVNSIKWNATGSLLASCSDDGTAKIWSMKQYNYVHDLTKHTKEIYTIRWSPTGPGTSNPSKSLMLASASVDSTIKLWDVELGRLLCSFNGHRGPVHSVAFSPNGEYLASGSQDKCIHIWSVKERRIVKTYKGSGSIFDLRWNKEGNKIAACFDNNIVCVLDWRM